jgi:hypothetical protein
LLEAVAVGLAFTVTEVVAVLLQPNELYAVTVYVPAADVVTLLMAGLCAGVAADRPAHATTFLPYTLRTQLADVARTHGHPVCTGPYVNA